MDEKDQIKTKTIVILGIVVVAIVYLYTCVTDPDSVNNTVFDWVSAAIGIGIFFFGVYYVMYNRFPSLK